MSTALPELKNTRLIIRELTMNDLQDAHQTYVDADWVDTDVTAEQALDERREWLEWTVRNYRALGNLYQPPYGDRAITLHDGTFVGMVGIVPCLGEFGVLPYFAGRGFGCPHTATAEMGLFWALLKAHQGQGYATEAAQTIIDYLFNERNLDRIIAQTDHDNLASQQVMERLGMRLDRNPNPDPHYIQVVGILENPKRNPSSE
ncbi:MAG: GNAT family N-acetyltransferase [Aggregatilineales bacterium]